MEEARATMDEERAFSNVLQIAGTKTLHYINQNTPEHNMFVLPLPKVDHYSFGATMKYAMD